MRELLELLEHDGRRSIKELATMLGRSEYEIEEQMKKLEKEKIILGYNTMIDWEKYGDDSVSAMIGRLGYALAPKPVIDAMNKIHQYTMICAPITAQIAGLEAIRNGQKHMKKMVAEYDRRRRLIYEGFTSMGLKCFEPKGAFYIFPDISSTGLSSEEFAEQLLLRQHVAVVPGTAFGECGKGFIRASYATSVDNISGALARIKNFLDNL